MDNQPKQKWYFKISSLIIAFLCAGPFMLPLVWFNPRLGIKAKIILTAIIIILSYYLWVLFLVSLKAIGRYYQTILF